MFKSVVKNPLCVICEGFFVSIGYFVYHGIIDFYLLDFVRMY
jgi:hypothetical protein